MKTKVKYLEDIVVTRDTEKIARSRKKVIQVNSDIGKVNYSLIEEDHLN